MAGKDSLGVAPRVQFQEASAGERAGSRALMPRVLRIVAALVLVGFLSPAGGCGHLPKIIVLQDPLSAEEHVTLGVAYERNGELALAAREYERALAKDKTAFQARVNLGNVRLAEKRYDRAGKEYLAALALRPGDPEATNNLAWAAILSGSGREEALRRMEAVLAASEHRSPPLLDTFGVLLGELSRPDEAELAFAEARRRCEEKDPACTEDVSRELDEHREALRARRPPTAAPPP
jgi:tetratricopeptide (TPR) repeat protein